MKTVDNNTLKNNVNSIRNKNDDDKTYSDTEDNTNDDDNKTSNSNQQPVLPGMPVVARRNKDSKRCKQTLTDTVTVRKGRKHLLLVNR